MWPEAEQTHELLDMVRQGDESATGRLLQRHRKALCRMVNMRLDQQIRRRLDVSDIIQDVMVEANRRLQNYLENPVMPCHLWLRQIAKDRLIDAHRRHRISVDREQAAVVAANLDHSTIQFNPQVSDKEMTPAATAVYHEMQRTFEKAIREMDEQDQEIIVMRHFEKLSNQEVAQALELTEPAASMRYLRAIRRLRKRISNDDVEE